MFFYQSESFALLVLVGKTCCNVHCSDFVMCWYKFQTTSDSIVGMLLCVALSQNLISKWTPAMRESETVASNSYTPAKRSRVSEIKKVGDDSGTYKENQLHTDSRGNIELKEALEVCTLSSMVLIA